LKLLRFFRIFKYNYYSFSVYFVTFVALKNTQQLLRISLQTMALQFMYKFLSTFHPGGIRTHDRGERLWTIGRRTFFARNILDMVLAARVARFSFVQHTKTGKNTKWP
jgi:hypothetical protein